MMHDVITYLPFTGYTDVTDMKIYSVKLKANHQAMSYQNDLLPLCTSVLSSLKPF